MSDREFLIETNIQDVLKYIITDLLIQEEIDDYMRYENKMNLNDEKNPICILHDFVWNAKQDILAATTPEELDKIEGKFILADQILKSIFCY